MSNEKRKCKKCKKYFCCDNHQILPKTIFGEGETDNLCKNCHDEYHRFVGHKYFRKENKQNMEFYLHKYYKLLYGAGIIAIVLFVAHYT